MARVSWPGVLERAAAIVDSYDTRVTLRQLFYRLVSEELIPNTNSMYSTLSSASAAARRDGWFPSLFDRTRTVHRRSSWRSPVDILASARAQYRRDRTENQEYQLWLGLEKNGLVNLVSDWFQDLGLPVVALGGYSSQSYVDEITEEVHGDGRPAVLLYAGDFDPSGIDIERDFVSRTDCWEDAIRVALTPEQVVEHRLPPLPGKATDTRAARFTAMFGELVQVEVDALPPDVLRGLFGEAISGYWDDDLHGEVRDAEDDDRELLRLLVEIGRTKGLADLKALVDAQGVVR